MFDMPSLRERLAARNDTAAPRRRRAPRRPARVILRAEELEGRALPSHFTCTQVIGFSQTNQWYSSGQFESRVDNSRWELLWNGGAGIEQWRNPNYVGWNNAPVSPCAQGSRNPDRVVLTISGNFQADPNVWVSNIQATLANIRARYPAVRQIILQPVVGGPNHNLCYYQSQVVRASFNHPGIDEAISRMIGGDVVAGASPEVRTCGDYSDATGHLIPAARGPIGATLGDFYAAFPDPIVAARGIYCSCPPTTGQGTGSVIPAVAQKDFVSGILVRIGWSTLEPADNQFRWDLLDEQIQRAAQYGKKVTLAVINGPSAPAWLYAAGAQPFDYLFRGSPARMPVPWDPIYLSQWTELILWLGARYAAHATVAHVHVTHSTYNGFEMQLPSSNTDITNWNRLGYTHQRVSESWAVALYVYAYAFPATALDVELHPVLRSDEVPYNVMYYAWYSYGTRVGAFAGWWSQRNTTVYPGPWELLQWGPYLSFSTVQFVTNATNNPNGFGEGGIQRAIDLAYDTGIRYLEIWNADILNPAFDGMLRDLAARLGGGFAPGGPGGSAPNGGAGGGDSPAALVSSLTGTPLWRNGEAGLRRLDENESHLPISNPPGAGADFLPHSWLGEDSQPSTGVPNFRYVSAGSAHSINQTHADSFSPVLEEWFQALGVLL